MTEQQAMQAILQIAGRNSGCRYKLIRHVDHPTTPAGGQPKTTTLLLRDDGYRFHYMVLESPAPNTVIGEWLPFAEYKQCDFPRHAEIIANHIMTAVAIEALES